MERGVDWSIVLRIMFKIFMIIYFDSNDECL